jgi:hypothetical protein
MALAAYLLVKCFLFSALSLGFTLISMLQTAGQLADCVKLAWLLVFVTTGSQNKGSL